MPALLLCMSLLAATRPVDLCLPADRPAPVDYAAGELTRQWRAVGLEATVTHAQPAPGRSAVVVTIPGPAQAAGFTRAAGLTVPDKPESYAVGPLRQGTWGSHVLVAGRDALGAMYGLLDLADLLPAMVAQERRRVPATPAADLPELAFRKLAARTHSAGPLVEFRAPNPFLSLPYPPDQPWWFLSDEFWTRYLDLLAHCRFNWLDLHGMYDVARTNFPNIYPYFVNSKTFPAVGVPDGEKARNLAMLKKVAALAKRRGIRVALMSYHASWDVTGAPQTPYEATDDNLALYTRECVAALLREVPDLALIGFRIGESGRHENFYQVSYLPGIADSGLDIPLHTRSWGANHADILALGDRFPGRFLLEIKYNGEQYGLPHIVAGGRMAGWGHYSYEDYSSFPRPYSILWQIRANGTHRFFRWADPDFIRATARCCGLAGALGYSLESTETYYPQMDYFHLPEPACGHGHPHWVMDRYWLWYLLWGRLTYDPEDTDWRALATHRLAGGDPEAGREMLDRIQAAGRIVSYIYAGHCLGPDHRNMAPEFETGGDILTFGRVQPLDTFSIQSVPEYVANVLAARPDGRLTPLFWAQELERLSWAATSAVESAPDSDEWRCWAQDNAAVAHLARYYAGKTRAALALELFAQTGDEWQAGEATRHLSSAIGEWRGLSAVTGKHYAYVHDTLRMHDPQFQWRKLTPEVSADREKLHRRLAELRDQWRGRGLAVGHVPVRLLAPAEPLTFRATALGNEAAQIEAVVELDDGQWHTFPLRRLLQGRGEVTVGPAHLPPDQVRYYLCVCEGAASACLPAGGRDTPFVVRRSLDGPPRFTLPATIAVTRRAEDSADLRVAATAADRDGIEKAWVWYKPLPSTRSWRRRPATVTPAEHSRWQIAADLPCTPEGIMCAVEVADASGQASRSPGYDPRRPGIPYEWLDPWPGPLPQRQALPSLRADLMTRDRFSALVLGRVARRFHQAPPAVKQAVLDAVQGGLNLVIFNQDFPDNFTFDWLPGGLRGGDADLNSVQVSGGHPITEGLPATVEAEKIVNDALQQAGEGWQVLTDPPALAVRKIGRGQVVICQLRVLELFSLPLCRRLVSNTLAFARDGSDKPLLVLDEGTGALETALYALDLPWQTPEDGMP